MTASPLSGQVAEQFLADGFAILPGLYQESETTALTASAVSCPVPAGGAMRMRPLLLHASNRSTSDRPRRVIHLEFSSAELAGGLEWQERHF